MLKQTFKLLFHCVIIGIISCCFIFSGLIRYALSQGKGQLAMVINAIPINLVLTDTLLADSLKPKLRLVGDIKQFAVDSLGLTMSKNYSTFYDGRSKPELYTVTACEAYSLKSKEWWFPVVGTVSYKGFFNKEDARKEINALKKQGFDVEVYVPSGWSTLGWFTDPVQLNMLLSSYGSLANTIIHELTHGTLFIKNKVTFNENLANLIADKGAEQFLKLKFGNNSMEFMNYKNNKADEKKFNEYMLQAVSRLDSLYFQLNTVADETEKKSKKQHLIFNIVTGVNKLNLKNKKRYFNYSLHAFKEGNAFFCSFSRYDSHYNELEVQAI